MNDKGAILVVDDERTSLSALTSLLSGEGYQVRLADSGQLALASVAAKTPELILLDIHMPGMDGFEVCRRLKAAEVSRDIPIVFLSATREVADRIEGFRLGAVDYMTKPYRPEELLARVQTHLDVGRLRSRLERQVAQRTAELRVVNERLQVELAGRKRAEQALRESELRFRNLANRAPVGIWVIGPDRTATFYNRRALLFVGRSMEQLISSGWGELVHPEDVESVYARYLPAVDARRSFRIECRVRRANGRYRWVLATGIPISSKGTYSGHIGTCIDITDLKRSHDQLLATQKLESFGVMAAGIAHDFNNLLGGVLAESDLALSELPPDSPARENVEHINAVASRASEIVDLLMACAGGQDVVFEEVDLTKIVAEMLELLQVSLPSNTMLDFRLDSGLSAIRANSSQIRQLILNLVKNSSEALQGGDGIITVTTRTVHLDRSTAAELPPDLPDGDYAGLIVSDTGCGMVAEVRNKVFDPFYTTKFTGRGLGLAVVQGIIRSHGGAIKVMSTPGKGSTFEILLPFAGRHEIRQLTADKQAGEANVILDTVLVVEDEEALQLAVSKALNKAGFRVLAAGTGEAALEIFRAHSKTINLILLDLNLPGISGTEMLVEVRHIRPDIKVVITTGYDPQSIGAGYLWSGQAPSAFFRKPYRLLELVRSVRELVLPQHDGHGAAA